VLAGIGALLTGCWLLVDARLSWAWRLPLLAGWLGHSTIELLRQLRGFRRVRTIAIRSDGRIVAHGPAGRNTEVRLLTGSAVYPGVAWLRIKGPDGGHYGELLTAGTAGTQEWQGLQLIWQQCRDRFGPAGAA
jgi:hypothetical protein